MRSSRGPALLLVPEEPEPRPEAFLPDPRDATAEPSGMDSPALHVLVRAVADRDRLVGGHLRACSALRGPSLHGSRCHVTIEACRLAFAGTVVHCSA